MHYMTQFQFHNKAAYLTGREHNAWKGNGNPLASHHLGGHGGLGWGGLNFKGIACLCMGLSAYGNKTEG